MNNILAIDIALNHLGFAIFINDNLVESYVMKTSNDKNIDKIENKSNKLHEINYEINELIIKYNTIDVLVYEQPFFLKDNLITTRDLAIVEGCILLSSSLLGIKAFPVKPQTWKQFVIGKGNASKEEIASVMFFKYDMNINRTRYGNLKNSDELDAIGLGLYYINKGKMFL